MTFSDFAEVVPGLYIGSHPEPEDPFELGATVVVPSHPARLHARSRGTAC